MMLTLGSRSWHGPHTAYFFAFIMGGFLQSLGKQIRSSVRPFFLPPGTLDKSPRSGASNQTFLKTAYDVVSVFNVQATLNYIVIPFLLVDVPASIEAYRRLGWYGHYATFVPLAFFWLGGGGVLRSFLTEREAGYVTSATKELDAYQKRIDERHGDGVNSIAPVPTEGLQPNGSAKAGAKKDKEKKKDR